MLAILISKSGSLNMRENKKSSKTTCLSEGQYGDVLGLTVEFKLFPISNSGIFEVF